MLPLLMKQLKKDGSMKSQNKYKNSFYNKNAQGSQLMLSCDKPPEKYKGYLIYHRLSECFDIVKGGVCVSMCAGSNGAKSVIDRLISGKL